MTKEEYQQKKRGVIEEIERAFAGVSREDGVTLHEAMVIDDYGSPRERAKARLEDTEARWQDVPHEHIKESDAVLSFLDEKGFCYYLPAYLLWDLRYAYDNNDDDIPDDFSSNTFDSIRYHLGAFGDQELDDYRLKRFEFFNFQQSKAVAHYLVFQCERLIYLDEQEGLYETRMSSEYKDHQRALDKYWGQFLSG